MSIRGDGTRSQPSPDNTQFVRRATAEKLMETQLALFIVSAHETLSQDFGFDADQLKRFQELWLARMEQIRLKRK